MKRILFVDDEQNVLDGLQNILRRQRKEWQMVFALGGKAALTEMEQAPFDVVVSDMRMPGMDGATLLTLVRDRYPGTARIVLSGHAEREATMRALPVVHQFLHKPCDSAALKAVIERTCGLQALLQSETIRGVIGKLDRLPSPPTTYLELSQALASSKSSVGEIADIVEHDPAMSAKILQLVNSAYFGLSRQATSIRQAVSYLGMEVLRGLSLSAHVFAKAEGSALSARALDGIQQASFATAMIARQLCGAASSDDAFTAGVVHDIGRIVIGMGIPQSFREIDELAIRTERPKHLVEQEVLGVSHAEVGAYLLGVWGLPIGLVETVAYHHAPAAAQTDTPEVLAAIHVADVLVERRAVAEREPAAQAELDRPFLERHGMLEQLPRWEAVADAYLRKLD